MIENGFKTQDVFLRNFEALKRAEEQLEREDLARKEVSTEKMFWKIFLISGA